MAATIALNASLLPESDELCVEELVLNTWIEDSGDYLRLDADESSPIDDPPWSPQG